MAKELDFEDGEAKHVSKCKELDCPRRTSHPSGYCTEHRE